MVGRGSRVDDLDAHAVAEVHDGARDELDGHPGPSSSGGRPGWTTTEPLVEPRSVATAEPWSAPDPGRTSRWVEETSWCGLATATRRGALGDDAAGLRGAADQDGAVDVHGLAVGEDAGGRPAGR